MPNEVCFVVMGFGRKTDYGDQPRTLDLDATYHAIIRPAVEAAGLECLRADEIPHSGVIDQKMFELLLRADLVVADISTANPNALYELGVRHALRPLSTIIIKEQEGKFLFDLSHLATMQYKHLGDDIGAREATAKKAELQSLIMAVRKKKEMDSPVYTFLRELREPVMSEAQFMATVHGAKADSDRLSKTLEEARKADRENRHVDARDHLTKAYDQQMALLGDVAKIDPFIIQQLAIHTYKCELPSRVEGLLKAWETLGPLRPEYATDPETLSIAGAIQRKLWVELKERPRLDAAIQLYGRGFDVRGDYNNGEKYAICLDTRAAVQASADEALYDRMTAHKVRERMVQSLRRAFADPATDDSADYKWMLAAMANTLYALADPSAPDYEAMFRAQAVAAWEIERFERGKTDALTLVVRAGGQAAQVSP